MCICKFPMHSFYKIKRMQAQINTYKIDSKSYILDVTKETKHTRQHGFMLKYQNHNIYIFTN